MCTTWTRTGSITPYGGTGSGTNVKRRLNYVKWWRGYYPFIRPHQRLRERIPGDKYRYRDRTPAMALGLTDHLWTVEELLRTLVLTRLAHSDPSSVVIRTNDIGLAA